MYIVTPGKQVGCGWALRFWEDEAAVYWVAGCFM
jgi:hypothetical protein